MQLRTQLTFVFSPLHTEVTETNFFRLSFLHTEMSLPLPGGNFYTLLHGGRKVGAKYDPESMGSSVLSSKCNHRAELRQKKWH